MDDFYFKLHSSCIITSGKNRSIILDLQRNFFLLIPNDLAEIIYRYAEKLSYLEILSKYDIENQLVIKEYFDFLKLYEFIILTNDKKHLHEFKKLNFKDWKTYKSKDIILEYSKRSEYNLLQVVKDVLSQKPNAISMHLDCSVSFEKMFEILKLIDISCVQYMDLYLSSNIYNEQEIKDIAMRFLKISNVYIFNHNYQKKNTLFDGNTQIVYSNKHYPLNKHCGLIRKENFNVNLKFYAFSKNKNSCLFNKISIDENGNIKNCPSMKESFGNIKDMTLSDALNKQGFKKYWDIKKDDITGCKDCEFRHICTDCRAYIENPDDIHSKPLKCGYNPYTNEWEEWSINPLKQKSIDFYGIREIIK